MIRKIGKYEISTSSDPVTRYNYWSRTFIVCWKDKSLTIKFPSYEIAMTLHYSEDEYSVNYCLAKYRAEVKNWLKEIDVFLGIN